MALFILISVFLNIQNLDHVQSVHNDLHVNQLGDIKLMCQFSTTTELKSAHFNKIIYKLKKDYLSNFDSYNVLNCNKEDGIIIVKDITRYIDHQGLKINSGYKILNAQVSWDVKVIFSTNRKITLSKENMHIKYTASNHQNEFVEILSLEDAFDGSANQIKAKRKSCIENIEKEIKQIKNAIERNNKSLNKEDKQERKQKLLVKIATREGRLKLLNDKAYRNDLIKKELNTILNDNITIYLTEWDFLKQILSPTQVKVSSNN